MLDPALYNHVYLTSDVDQASLDHIRAAVNAMDRPITIPLGGSGDEAQEVKLAPKPILLHIDSPGGLVKSCISIIKILLNAKTPVHTVVEGMAASSAALIFACGQKRFAYPDSVVLVHQHRKTLHPHIPETITHEDDLVEAEQGTALYELMKGFLSERTKMTPALLQSLLSRDKLLSASEAKRLGLVTHILAVPALHPTPAQRISPKSDEAYNHIVIGVNTVESFSIVKKIHTINRFRNTSTQWHGHIIGGTPQPIALQIDLVRRGYYFILAIVNAIQSSLVPVTSFMEGQCSGWDVLVSLVCHERFLYYKSTIQLDFRYINMSESKAQDSATNTKVVQAFIRRIFATRTKWPKADLHTLFERAHVLDATRALEWGLCDGIITDKTAS
jgi:ATP-dependent protease ClpP protease subunit